MKKLILILVLIVSVQLSNYSQSYGAVGVTPDTTKTETKLDRFINLVSKLDLDSTTMSELNMSAVEVVNEASVIIETKPTKESSIFDWLNWFMVIGGVVALLMNWVVRLFPTHSKYAGMFLPWFELISKLFNAAACIVPNRMKGGGKHV